MATVVDALVVTFGLDPKNFNKEQKELVGKLKKLSDQSRKTAKEASHGGTEMANSFRKVKIELLGLVAALGAATGVKGFLRDMVGGQADLSRLSRNVDVSARRLEAWGTVAAGVGEKAATAYNAMMALTMGIGEARIKGHSGLTDVAMQYGINLTGAKNAQDVMMRIAQRIRSLPHAEGMYAANQMGLGGLYNVLDMPEDKLKKYLKYASALSRITHNSMINAEKLQMQWAMMGQRLRGVEERIFTAVAPALSRLMADFSKWVDSVNWEQVASEVESIASALFKWASGFDWKGFWSEFKSGVKEVWQLLKAMKPLIALAEKFAPKGRAKGGSWTPMDTSTALGNDAKNALTAASMWAARHANDRSISDEGSVASKAMKLIARLGGNKPYTPVHIGSQKVTWRPLGIRNNNPLDLRYAGQSGATPGEKGFAKFASMQEGIMAAASQLRRYAARGNDTIEGIVKRFAPEEDGNDVKKYVETVMKIMSRHYKGVTSSSHLPILKDPAMLTMLMRAMTVAEGTSSYISNSDIMSGVYTGAYAGRGYASHSSKSETHIGKIEVHTKATNANGIASDMGAALHDHPLAFGADSGVH